MGKSRYGTAHTRQDDGFDGCKLPLVHPSSRFGAARRLNEAGWGEASGFSPRDERKVSGGRGTHPSCGSVETHTGRRLLAQDLIPPPVSWRRRLKDSALRSERSACRHGEICGKCKNKISKQLAPLPAQQPEERKFSAMKSLASLPPPRPPRHLSSNQITSHMPSPPQTDIGGAGSPSRVGKSHRSFCHESKHHQHRPASQAWHPWSPPVQPRSSPFFSQPLYPLPLHTM
jgi:hypothetical protein